MGETAKQQLIIKEKTDLVGRITLASKAAELGDKKARSALVELGMKTEAKQLAAYEEMKFGKLGLASEAAAFAESLAKGTWDMAVNPSKWIPTGTEFTPVPITPWWSVTDYIGAMRAAQAWEKGRSIEAVLKFLSSAVPVIHTPWAHAIIDEYLAKRFERAVVAVAKIRQLPAGESSDLIRFPGGEIFETNVFEAETKDITPAQTKIDLQIEAIENLTADGNGQLADRVRLSGLGVQKWSEDTPEEKSLEFWRRARWGVLGLGTVGIAAFAAVTLGEAGETLNGVGSLVVHAVDLNIILQQGLGAYSQQMGATFNIFAEHMGQFGAAGVRTLTEFVLTLATLKMGDPRKSILKNSEIVAPNFGRLIRALSYPIAGTEWIGNKALDAKDFLNEKIKK